MKAITPHTKCIVTRSYEEYHSRILNYITFRINHRCEAEDLAQDVFIRLLAYRQMLRPDTVKYFLYAISRNIVTDYLRRLYKKQEIDSYLCGFMASSSNEVEESILAHDLLVLEQHKLATLPEQRKRIYTLSRFEEKSTLEIADTLQLSKRTVENHLLLGRREMRAYLKKCI